MSIGMDSGMTRQALFDALEVRASRLPEATVLQGEREAWTLAAINAAIASLLALFEGKSPQVLAILADNAPAWVIADLAALQAGIPQLPLPGFFTAAQMVHALEETGSDVFLTDQPERVVALGLGFVHEYQWCGLAVMRRACSIRPLPEGTAKISFTSGSTGNPKGVCLSAEGLLDTAHALTTRLASLPLNRHLAVLPLALLLENVAGVYASLLLGAEIHLPSLKTLGWRGTAGFDPAALHDCTVASKANSVILVPELLKSWVFHLGKVGAGAPADLVYAAVGGARVDATLLTTCRAFGLPAFQGYGLTECGSVVSLNRPGDDCRDGNDCGRPLDHVRVRIDAQGEIHISARAFLGYLGDHAAAPTSEFATGDLGFVDNQGHVHLSGRRKNILINSYGRNIAPEWVESALLAEPAIAQVMVSGDARPWLAALLVPAPGANATAVDAAISRVNRDLPDYAQIRRWVAVQPFTVMNGLATGNGRPMRANILKEHAASLAALYAEKEIADVVL